MATQRGIRAGRPRRPLRSFAALCVVAVLGLAVPPATSQPPTLRAEPGEWVGFVSFRGADLPFAGRFSFTSAGGTLDGEFSWSGANTVLSGIVTGPDTMPQFVMTSVVSAGVNIPDVSGGGEVQFTAATCERIEGVGVNIQTTAPVSDTVWWAVRRDSTGSADIEAFFDAAARLQEQVDLLVDDIVNERMILSIALLDLRVALQAAEQLSDDLERTPSCGSEVYRSVVAGEVQRLLDFLLSNPEIESLVFAQTLLAIMNAGLVSPAGGVGIDIEVAVLDTLAARIRAAEAEGDVGALEIYAILAEDLGWLTLAAEARAALAGL